MFETIKGWYQKAWDWSYNAGSIVLARLTSLTGVFVGALSFIDWSPIYTLFGSPSLEFNRTQTLFLGAILFVQGLVQEIVRRSNTVVTESAKLIPAQITVPEVKAAKKAK